MTREHCPYCHASVEINHDDGYGMSEDEMHSQECRECGRTFAYETVIVVEHVMHAAPCLDDEDAVHSFEQFIRTSMEGDDVAERRMRRCRHCGIEEEVRP